MTNHPLRSEDYTLIQDYFLTKVILGLNAELDAAGWDHEIDNLQNESGSFWVRRNGLLFDYTLARVLSACPNGAAEIDASIVGESEVFVRGFVDAVSRQDTAIAEYLWSEVNFGEHLTLGTRLPSTVPLLARLRNAWPKVHAREVTENLPPELFPSSSVS
ncbi:hypothetical protein LZG07_16880 [Microbacterium profundi]|uniref:hypothetical protein n=1 Tax=Microbacterium profundi TaxID=450380 RepID=UPI001F212111|nr:hypothetical protein [Microbacterium profundi]MCE7483572.1 hypothetical protein [Microbacterium profundi]